jgi:hypothetical protein
MPEQWTESVIITNYYKDGKTKITVIDYIHNQLLKTNPALKSYLIYLLSYGTGGSYTLSNLVIVTFLDMVCQLKRGFQDVLSCTGT